MTADRESGEVRLDRQAISIIGNMQFHAAGVGREIYEAHRRPVRHNHTIERLALWHTVELDLVCEQSLYSGTLPSWGEVVAGLEPEVRCIVQSSAAVIPNLVPFGSNKDRLRVAPDESFEAWGNVMMRAEPFLVAGWHEWLWDKSGSIRDRPNDFGESSTLAVAANQLEAGLRLLLETARLER